MTVAGLVVFHNSRILCCDKHGFRSHTRIYSHCQCPFREGQNLSFNLQISSNMKPMFCVDDSKGRNFCEEMKC